ncbi:hypothetical protein HDG33_002058 [Paraburkholderia sp. Cpub6]|nr:hypothetical protein [Paraburkholderia sp. Cpub6]
MDGGLLRQPSTYVAIKKINATYVNYRVLKRRVATLSGQSSHHRSVPDIIFKTVQVLYRLLSLE